LSRALSEIEVQKG